MSTYRAELSYRVARHEHVDDKFVMVALKCIGYPTDGLQPVAWEFAIKVPRADLADWPLGVIVRLTVA